MDTEKQTTMNSAQCPRAYLFMVTWVIGTLMLFACGIETPMLAQPLPVGRTNQPPTAIPAKPTQLSGPLTALDGLYVGRYPGGVTAVAYLFKPSGRVAYDFYQSVIDPDAAEAWPTIKVDVEKEAKEKGFEPYSVNLGTYQLLGDRIRLTTQQLQIDSTRQVKFRETVFGDTFDQKGKELSFRALSDLSSLVIDGAVLLRQRNLTGTKLSGDFAQDGRATIRASFTPDGRFSWWFLSSTGGEERGTGRYQIQGNEIIFQYSDGTVQKKVFADLGRDKNGKVLALGGWILEER